MTRVLLFLVVFTAVAAAEESKTHKLYNQCKQLVRFSDGGRLSESEAADLLYCAGFISGFSCGFLLGANGVELRPERVSNEAFARSFVSYLNTHPGEIDSDDPAKAILNAWFGDELIVNVEKKGK